MAAPVIAASTEHALATGTTHTPIANADLPNWTTGDLALVYLTTDGAANTPSLCYFLHDSTYIWFKEIVVSATDTPSCTWFYRWFTGDEAGHDLTIVTPNSEPAYVVCMRITGVDREYPLIIPAAVVATTQNPNPPAIPALKEARDVLYVVGASHDHGTDVWSSDPANYTTVQNGNSGSGSGDCGGAVAYRAITNTAIAEDPGTFAWSGSEESVAWTIAVLGNLSPVVAEQEAVAVPASYQVLGHAAAYTAWIFSFTPRKSCNIEKIACYMAKVASPTDDVTFSIRTAYNGANAATTAAVDVQAAGWYEGTIASPYAVTAGTTYWVAIERTGAVNATNNYRVYYDVSANPLQTSYVFDGVSTYTQWVNYDFSFQARESSGPPAEVFANRSRFVSQAVQRAAVM